MKVIKRNGQLEDYEPAKIKRVVEAAGIKSSDSEKLVDTVTKRLEALSAEQISTIQIRDIVIEEMQKIDEYAANMFTWYQRGKDERQIKT